MDRGCNVAEDRIEHGDSVAGSRLLTWLHISDIHYGDGDTSRGYDKALVMERLLDDVRFMVNDLGLRPDAVFVTGDIAYSGGGSAGGEYTYARDFLKRLSAISGLTDEGFFLVPGNHDVDLSLDDTDQYKYLLESLRDGSETLDNLSDELHRVLSDRLARYSEFATPYGPAVHTLGRGGHWWSSIEISSLGGASVAVAGLNTSLTTRLRGNEGKLQLGQEVLVELERQGAGSSIVIALTHHPLSNEWLRDSGSHPTQVGAARGYPSVWPRA